MDFSDALKWCKEGKKLQRIGWNGKGQEVTFIPAKGNRLAYLQIKTVQGHLVPWLASQTDLLATDWEVVI